MNKNPYEVLGVSPSASDEEIRMHTVILPEVSSGCQCG